MLYKRAAKELLTTSPVSIAYSFLNGKDGRVLFKTVTRTSHVVYLEVRVLL